MPCFRPLKGYRSRVVNATTGKRSIVFNSREGFYDLPVNLPCGQCIGCRLERSRQWAIRCTHEASLYEENCFITLTYDDAHLPLDNSLNVKHFQDFMKRLRFRFGSGIRFFHCGEYGERFARPHYHACIFNFDFPDKELWKVERDVRLFRSDSLEELWTFGFSTIGDVTFESAAYVARYITKKITGDLAEDHYCGRKPEYTTMSRRPGIGRGWLSKHGFSEVYPDDFIVLREKKMKPPKYYDSQFEILYPSDFEKIKRRRKRRGELLCLKEPEARLSVKEEVQTLRFQQLKRSYESEA